MQEVTLVLVWIDAAQQTSAVDACVVPGREALAAQAARIVETDPELHFAVAEHVRIRRAAGREFGQEMIEHARAVLGSETHAVQGYSEFLRDRPRILEVGRGRAVTVIVLGPV